MRSTGKLHKTQCRKSQVRVGQKAGARLFLRRTSLKSVVRTVVLWLFSLTLGSTASGANFQHLETRYGKIDAIDSSDKISIHYRGKVILRAEADGASMFRITSDTGNEYVIVNFTHGGLNCRGFFHLIELSPDGAVKVSHDFGECYELGGAGFVTANPVVHLQQTIDDNSIKMASFIWREETISKIFESTDRCRSLAFSAKTISKKENANTVEKHTGGAGRVQFYSAPSDTCAKKGVFVLSGERLTSSLRLEDFVYVTYTNPKTARQTEGWVHADRLFPAEKWPSTTRP